MVGNHVYYCSKSDVYSCQTSYYPVPGINRSETQQLENITIEQEHSISSIISRPIIATDTCKNQPQNAMLGIIIHLH